MGHPVVCGFSLLAQYTGKIFIYFKEMFSHTLANLAPVNIRRHPRNGENGIRESAARGASASTGLSDSTVRGDSAMSHQRSSSRGKKIQYRSWSSHAYTDVQGKQSLRSNSSSRGIASGDELLSIESLTFGLVAGGVRLGNFSAPRGQRGDSTLKSINVTKGGSVAIGALRVAPYFPGDSVSVSLGTSVVVISLAQGNMERIGDFAYSAIQRVEALLPQQLLKIHGRNGSFDVSFNVRDPHKLLMMYKILSVKSKGIVSAIDSEQVSTELGAAPLGVITADDGHGEISHNQAEHGDNHSQPSDCKAETEICRNEVDEENARHDDHLSDVNRANSHIEQLPVPVSQPVLRGRPSGRYFPPQQLPPPTQMTALRKSKRHSSGPLSADTEQSHTAKQELQAAITTPRDQMIEFETLQSRESRNTNHALCDQDTRGGPCENFASMKAREDALAAARALEMDDEAIQLGNEKLVGRDERRERLRAQLDQLRRARHGKKYDESSQIE